MARAVGLREKGLYKVSEVSLATGVPVPTLHAEVRAGRLASFTPPGRKRGRLVAPEWVDEWMRSGR